MSMSMFPVLKSTTKQIFASRGVVFVLVVRRGNREYTHICILAERENNLDSSVNTSRLRDEAYLLFLLGKLLVAAWD